jgi:hypothetical protein
MNTSLQWRVLESPWSAVAVLLVLALTALLIWRRYRRRGWIYLAGGLALAAAGVWLSAGALVTPREQIAQAIDRLAWSAQRKDLSVLYEVVDPDYDDGRYDRDTLLGLASRYYAEYRVGRVAIDGLEVELSGDSAKATFRANINVEIPMIGREVTVPSSWTTQWIRRPQGGGSVWRLRSARLDEPENIPDAPGRV